MLRSKRSEPDALVLLDLLSRLRALQALPWVCIHSMESRRGLAAVATLLGAGMMGAMMFVRGISRRVGSAGSQEEYTVPGLVNSGNNCFLNAVLQALASSEKVLSYLTASWSSEKLQNLPLSAEVSKLLRELSEVRTRPRTLNPRSLMLALGHYVKNFDLAAQQDAAEALTHLATAVQQERMEDFERQRPAWQSLADASAPPDAEVENVLDFWRQQLRWPTEGTIGSLLVCSKCNFKASMHFQIFRDLPLCPPQTTNGSIAAGCSLEDCLLHFTMVERLQSVKCNRCAHMAAIRYLSLKSENNKDLITTIRNCNSEDLCSCEFLTLQQGGIWFDALRDAEKSLLIGRCPEVLCIHIQRVTVNGGQLEKLKGHVSFPVELDLYPFTIAARKKHGSVLSTKVEFSPGRALDPEQFMMSLSSRCLGGNATSMDCDSHQIPPSKAVEEEEHIRSEADMEVDAPEEVYKVVYEADVETTPTKKVPDNSISGNGELYTRRKTYNLLAVVVHYGGATGGHYTVYRKVKVPRQRLNGEKQNQSDAEQMAIEEEDLEEAWFQISDADVTRVSVVEVLSAEASLLFYEQRE